MITRSGQIIGGKLPGGFVDDNGKLHQRVILRALSGLEEELLANGSGSASARITQVLAQCLLQLGEISPIGDGIVRSLLVADRQYLMLLLRELTFGKHIKLTLMCSNCDTKIDIDFSTHDIPVEESSDKGPLYTIQLEPELAYQEHGVTHREVVFRLPNGEDQETLESLLPDQETIAGRQLLARCIQRLGTIDQPGPDRIYPLAPAALMAIEQAIEKVAPSVGMMMEGLCPECDHDFEMPFDIQALILYELSVQARQLYRQIHYLAFHYHWSEAEIMAMSRTKRWHYITVLAEEIEKMNNEH